MSTQPEPPAGSDLPAHAAWAPRVERLTRADRPTGALNLNVDGRRLSGPLQGFGQMWQKTYRVRLTGSALAPAAVIATWKERFPEFWPRGNRFYAPLAGIAPGEVALVNLSMPGGVPLSTGVMVLYADAESFTLMTPEGHVFSGWITFSANRDADTTAAQAQILMRANDPMYELGLMFGGHRMEDDFWRQTLTALATHLGAADATVETTTVCVDSHRQWSRAGNIRYNAAMGTLLDRVARPFRRPASR
jgi:hypothetical protein